MLPATCFACGGFGVEFVSFCCMVLGFIVVCVLGYGWLMYRAAVAGLGMNLFHFVDGLRFFPVL